MYGYIIKFYFKYFCYWTSYQEEKSPESYKGKEMEKTLSVILFRHLMSSPPWWISQPVRWINFYIYNLLETSILEEEESIIQVKMQILYVE